MVRSLEADLARATQSHRARERELLERIAGLERELRRAQVEVSALSRERGIGLPANCTRGNETVLGRTMRWPGPKTGRSRAATSSRPGAGP